MRFRAATFNIRHGLGMDGRVDLERTAAAIRAAAPDVIALQELDRGHPRSGGMDQAATLAAATGLRVVFHPTVRASDFDYGIALASSEPVEADFLPLPGGEGEEPRAAIVAAWRGVSVVATHLSLVVATRDRQLQTLARWVTELPPPVLLLGDLNQRHRRLDILKRAGFHVPRARRTTFGRGLRSRQIDHILAGPGLRLLGAWTTGGIASDHLALVAELETT